MVWVNEEGIKIMRSHLHLDSADAENAWTRIGHADRPNRPGWEEMVSVWKAHVEWVDEAVLEDGNSSQSEADTPKQPSQQVEKLVVGWGDTIWVIHVFPDRITPAVSRTEEKRLGAAEVVSMYVNHYASRLKSIANFSIQLTYRLHNFRNRHVHSKSASCPCMA